MKEAYRDEKVNKKLNGEDYTKRNRMHRGYLYFIYVIVFLTQ